MLGTTRRHSLQRLTTFLMLLPISGSGQSGSNVSDNEPNFQASGGGSIRLAVHEEERIEVTTSYWRLGFDLRNGGVLDTIIFLHGSGKNLLLESFRTYVDQWSDHNAAATEFHSSRTGDTVRLEFTGAMAGAGREAGPVEFRTTWTLSPFVVRADHRISFSRDAMVTTVGVGSTAVRKELDEFGVRVGPVDDPDPRKRALVRLGKAHASERQLIREHHAPIYMLFFQRDVEGFDMTTASDLATWASGLTGKEGLGRYEAILRENGDAIRIRREPLHSTVPVKVPKGEYTFSYYLGLPRIVERANRKWRHLSFNNHPWPSDSEIERWAGNGVNLVRLHNDYAADGNFWHDGAWPPYDEKGMAEMRRVIAACHRHGIQVVPYFSIYEFHPDAQGYKEHEREWKRTTDQLGTVFHNSVLNGEYGAQMCPQSGWLQRRKQDVEKAYRDLGFDGIYYDWTRCQPCNNKNHNVSLHLATDQVIDLLAWTRRLIAPNGVLILHMPGNTPCITMENFADLVVNMEELSNATEMLRMETVPVATLLAESTPRSPCPSYRQDRTAERNRNNIAHMVVLGMFPWWDGSAGHYIRGNQAEIYEATLSLFNVFKPYRLENYRLYDALTRSVQTGWPDVYGAVYISPENALVVLSNTSPEKRENVVWRVNPESLGLSAPSRVTLIDNKTAEVRNVAATALTDGTLRTNLDGYEYRLFEVRTAK